MFQIWVGISISVVLWGCSTSVISVLPNVSFHEKVQVFAPQSSQRHGKVAITALASLPADTLVTVGTMSGEADLGLGSAAYSGSFVMLGSTGATPDWLKTTRISEPPMVAAKRDRIVLAGSFFSGDELLPWGTTSSSPLRRQTEVLALDRQGVKIWATVLDSPTTVDITGLRIADNGNVVVVGQYYGDLSVAGETLHNKNGSDSFVIVLDKFGTLLWSTSYRSKGYSYIRDVTWASDGTVVTCGNFDRHTLTLGKGSEESEQIALEPTGQRTAFLIRHRIEGAIGRTETSVPIQRTGAYYQASCERIESGNNTLFVIVTKRGAAIKFAGTTYPNGESAQLSKLTGSGRSNWTTRLTSSFVDHYTTAYRMVLSEDKLVVSLPIFTTHRQHRLVGEISYHNRPGDDVALLQVSRATGVVQKQTFFTGKQLHSKKDGNIAVLDLVRHNGAFWVGGEFNGLVKINGAEFRTAMGAVDSCNDTSQRSVRNYSLVAMERIPDPCELRRWATTVGFTTPILW